MARARHFLSGKFKRDAESIKERCSTGQTIDLGVGIFFFFLKKTVDAPNTVLY